MNEWKDIEGVNTRNAWHIYQLLNKCFLNWTAEFEDIPVKEMSKHMGMSEQWVGLCGEITGKKLEMVDEANSCRI